MPKVPSEDLYLLVKSLSQHEKRYFKYYASIGNAKAGNIYRRLFDVVEVMKHYDEKKVLQKIPEIKPAHLSSQKNYLKELIIESLRMYNSQGSVNVQLCSLISEIEILFFKRLFKECAKRIKKAKYLALLYGKYYLFLEVQRWEFWIVESTFSNKDAGTKTDEIANEFKLISDTSKKINDYYLLNVKVCEIYRKWGNLLSKEAAREVRLILRHPLLKSKIDSSVFNISFFHYYISGLCYYMLKDWNLFYVWQKKMVRNYELHPQFIKAIPFSYIGSLNNFIDSCTKTGREKEIEAVFFKVRNMVLSPDHSGNRYLMPNFITCLSSVIEYYCVSGDFKKGVLLSNEIKKIVTEFVEEKQSDKPVQMMINYTFACSRFGSGNFKEALYWLNNILNAQDIGVRNDILVFASILNLIVHFELGNVRELEYYTRSTRRYLSGKKNLDATQVLVIDFIQNKVHKVNSKREQAELFKKLRSKMESIYNNKTEMQNTGAFDVLSWIDSKISGKSFAQVVKEKWRSEMSAKK